MDPLQEETRDALLTSIKALAAKSAHPANLLRLAEAYAWAVSPGQSHGASGPKQD